MLERMLAFSIRHRAIVVLTVLAAALFGLASLRVLPIDAVPDVTNRQVQINATAPALGPIEVEKQVTFPLETALAGIPGLEYTRSFSRNGFAQVTAVFRDDVDVYFARQQVTERMAAAKERLPAGTETLMGPISTGLGEIYMWTVEYAHPHGAGATIAAGVPGWQPDGAYLTPEGERLRSDRDLAGYLRTVQDWIIRPQLKGVAGVAEIDVNGGYVKQYHVVPDVRALTAYGLSFHELLSALERNNLTHRCRLRRAQRRGLRRARRRAGGDGGGARDASGGRTRRRARARRRSSRASSSAARRARAAPARTARRWCSGPPSCWSAPTAAPSRWPSGERLADVQRSLPADVRARTVLDRSSLVDATIATVARNLAEGALLVVIVLFLMLGNFRAALITALAIPALDAADRDRDGADQDQRQLDESRRHRLRAHRRRRGHHRRELPPPSRRGAAPTRPFAHDRRAARHRVRRRRQRCGARPRSAKRSS